jgi:hypothetical protein
MARFRLIESQDFRGLKNWWTEKKVLWFWVTVAMSYEYDEKIAYGRFNQIVASGGKRTKTIVKEAESDK